MYLRTLGCARIALLVLALLSLFAPTIDAQELNFSVDGGTTFNDSFIIASGSSTTVEVYLSEVPPDTTLTSEGLFGFALDGDLDAGSPGSVTSASINPQYDFVNTGLNVVALDWEAAILFNSTPMAANILLGEFQYDSTGVGVSTFTFGDLRPGTTTAEAGWLTELGTELDQRIFGAGATDTFSLSLTASAVPEPSSMVFVVVGAMFLSVRRKREC